MLFLHARKLDFESDASLNVAVFRKSEATNFGIHSGDNVEIKIGLKKVIAEADLTEHRVRPGEIGLFRSIWEEYPIKNRQIVQVSVLSRPASIQAIIKKLLGKKLNERELRSIIDDIVSMRLGRGEISYFVASGFARHYSDEELYYLTKAMAETGEQLRLKGKIVDKHSVGGLAGNRTSMVAIPIISSLGIIIPKTSSRAVTSPAGTADTMEVLAPVAFTMKKVREFLRRNKGCLVWGGELNMAPADDHIIRASHPLGIEPYDKMIVSIMSKKVAMGIKYLIIDMPVGPTAKIPNLKIAWEIERKFVYLGKRFGMKVQVKMTEAREPIGRGVGPALEARDVLRVLQRHPLRPLDLEEKSTMLAGELMELCGYCRVGQGQAIATKVLESGQAWKQMQKIIKAQGGQPNIKADELTLGAIKKRYYAPRGGMIYRVDNHAIDDIARILGAPNEKLAGIHVHQQLGTKLKIGDPTFTLYAQSRQRMELAEAALKKLPIFQIK
ncbi:MAG: thymidine phosphorylase [Patescibacteria group bacterium]|jgi:AMP phosphorylase